MNGDVLVGDVLDVPANVLAGQVSWGVRRTHCQLRGAENA
jgi:hypothetical protein